MAPQPDHRDGPLEFAKLLELLNASEAHGNPAVASQEQHELEVPNSGTTISDPAMLPEDPPDEVENPFAAHIVRGMSKMKRG
jgi:hypothetical protein